MSDSTTPNAVVKRARNTVPIAPEASKDAKRLAAVVLEVLAGLRTPPQAATAIGLSQAGYYQLEARALRGLLEACVPKPKGRQPNPGGDLAQLQRQNERLQRDLIRQQSLVRVTQRSIGLSPPPAAPLKSAAGKKKRKRKPVVRALSLAKRLKQEAAEPATATAGESSPAPTG